LINQGYKWKELKATAGPVIRTEEIVNYFRYGYEQPKEGELFGVKVKTTVCPWNGENYLMTLGLATEKQITKTKNNLVFLIDVSGSMASEDKLPLLKKTFSYLTGMLGGDDTVSIVTYSGKEEVVLDGCEGNKADLIQKKINSLVASGSTNGEAGLKTAYQIAEKHLIQDGNNRIIIASDGDLNVGISSIEEMEKFISDKKKSGVYLSVLGFGYGNYRDGMMETIADKGNGVYYYIDGETEAEKVFCDDLMSTLYAVAEDVKLQITFDPQYVESYRLIGYENRALSTEDFENDEKDAGELGAGHNVTVCYELKLTEEAKTAEKWLDLAVRYKKPGETKSELNSYSFGCETIAEPDDDIRFISSAIELSMMLHGSKFINGDVTLDSISAVLESIKTDDKYKTEFKTLLEKLRSE
ncbi:MAG: von Willebrand factor type A domain-containing protein, partial [Clostridia bacterium]|nr:von Willebrand factor type A domain-containing protein [Clostridia bacterium]